MTEIPRVCMACIRGLVVEYTPATGETRVRFPADALLLHALCECMQQSNNRNGGAVLK